jgi:hypothetical protein
MCFNSNRTKAHSQMTDSQKAARTRNVNEPRMERVRSNSYQTEPMSKRADSSRGIGAQSNSSRKNNDKELGNIPDTNAQRKKKK